HQPQVLALVGAALERFGRLDVLVNNAGISPYYKRAELLEPDEWCEVLDTNLTGAFRCVHAAAQALFASHGSVINISSIAGSHGAERLAAYGAAKGGLDALTRSLAIEWAARGVRVNAVAPAFLDTPMTQGIQANARLYEHLLSRSPSGRFGLPSEVVGAVIFLASPAASFITGQILSIDGGWTAH
ncbi:MAG: SDR family NAD(P)-dependent oxidoreductase, partial [Chloroflexota bacterium]